MNYPNDLSWDEAMERLEMDVYDAFDWLCPPNDPLRLPDDGFPTEPELTPYWIHIAMFKKSVSDMKALSRKQRRDAIAWAWKDRAERRDAFLSKTNTTGK